MTNLLKESLILSSIYGFVAFLFSKFKQGYIYNFFDTLGKKFNYLLMNSIFWSYFFSYDKLDLYWKNSFFNKLVSFVLNLPTKLLRFINDKFYNILKHSFIYKFLVFLSNHFTILFGFVLIFTMMVPDHRWYNIYGVLTVFGLLFIFLIKTAINKDYDFNMSNVDISIIIFMIAIKLSFILSIFPKDSLNAFIYFVITFLALVLLINSTDKTSNLEILTNFLVIGAFLTALYGIYQWKVVGIEVNPSLTDITVNQGMSGRVFSTMGNPNVYGELLVLTMPFFIVCILNTKNLLYKLGYLLGFLITLVVLLKTGSRSAWVAFAFAIGTFIFFKNKKLLPIFILMGIFLVPFLPDSIYRRMLTIFNPNDSSLQYRKQILEPALPMLNDYWFTGVGLGSNTFNAIYKRYKSFTLKTVAHTHNLFLQIWLESGIIALLSFLWMGFRLIKKTTFVIKNSEDTKLANIAIGALSAIAGIIVMGFADHIWFYNRILFIFWIMVAVILASYKITINNEKRAD